MLAPAADNPAPAVVAQRTETLADPEPWRFKRRPPRLHRSRRPSA
ncbi:MAG: hypothetical protein OJF58_004860 [Enhydrobacter sp.]|nr:MAG: hypothetical protein OJF58_004860 [Enhydrobacter sp.]